MGIRGAISLETQERIVRAGGQTPLMYDSWPDLYEKLRHQSPEEIAAAKVSVEVRIQDIEEAEARRNKRCNLL